MSQPPSYTETKQYQPQPQIYTPGTVFVDPTNCPAGGKHIFDERVSTLAWILCLLGFYCAPCFMTEKYCPKCGVKFGSSI